MPKSVKRADAATYLKRHRVVYLEELKKAGRPIVLRINDSDELAVTDDESYQRLLALVEELEAIEGIRRGLEDVAQGRTQPAREALEDVREEHRRRHAP